MQRSRQSTPTTGRSRSGPEESMTLDGRKAAPATVATVRVALLADPDLPAEIARRLAGELPGLLNRRVSAEVIWDVNACCNLLAGDEQISVTHMVQAVQDRMPSQGWDIGVFLTDLPRRANTRPVVAEVSTADRIGMVSLPALGALRLYSRAREAIVRLIGVLFHRHPTVPRREKAGYRDTANPSGARSPIGRSEPTDGAVTRYLLPGLSGRLRLLAGMVRANRPWRLFTGLSRAMAGVFATATYGSALSSFWLLGVTLGPLRLAILTVASNAALVAWLIIDHELWERPTGQIARERAVLYNVATVITLTLGVLCLYAVLFAMLVVVVFFLLDAEVLRPTIQHAPTWSDYLALAWFTASLAMIGGAIGSSFEDDSAVRQAAYGERQRQRRKQQPDLRGGQDDQQAGRRSGPK
jgi:hypothetical protein